MFRPQLKRPQALTYNSFTIQKCDNYLYIDNKQPPLPKKQKTFIVPKRPLNNPYFGGLGETCCCKTKCKWNILEDVCHCK